MRHSVPWPQRPRLWCAWRRTRILETPENIWNISTGNSDAISCVRSQGIYLLAPTFIRVSRQRLWSSIFCRCCEPCTQNTPGNTNTVTWTGLCRGNFSQRISYINLRFSILKFRHFNCYMFYQLHLMVQTPLYLSFLVEHATSTFTTECFALRVSMATLPNETLCIMYRWWRHAMAGSWQVGEGIVRVIILAEWSGVWGKGGVGTAERSTGKRVKRDGGSG